MKKKIKWILLLLLLITGIGGIWLFFFYQPEKKVIDEVKDGSRYTEEEVKDGSGSDEDTAVLNENVYFYVGEDAKRINEAITAVEYEESELVIKFNKDTDIELASLKTGELFWLEGSKDTPLKDTYIGKVVSNTEEGEEILLSVDMPMMDEVFDKLYLNDELKVDPSNINNIRTFEGVTITPVEAIEADFLETADNQQKEETTNLVYNKEMDTELIPVLSSPPANFVVELNVDLSETLGIVPDSEQAEDFEKKCKLTGKIGVEDLQINYIADWDKRYGMRELAMGVSGKQVTKAGAELSIEGEISGDTTKKDIVSFIKMQGLEEKVFPIAYFDCTPAKPVVLKPNTAGKIGNAINKEIKKSYEYTIMPLSCGFMVYIDISGNLSMKFTMDYELTNEFENKFVIVKDNKYVYQFEGKSEPKEKHSAKLEAQADADIHIGASVMAYFFNINMADVAIAKVGAEAEGKGTFQTSSDQEEDSGLDVSFYARLYLKIIDAKAKLKVKANLWNIVNASNGISFEGTLLDKTLAETGQRKDTHYDESTMSWKKMTAEDKEKIYYKGLNGKLFREDKKGHSKKAIYDGEFFSICGLDQSYVYLLQASEDEKYNVRRVNKDGTTSKIILKDVKYVLLMEEQNLYYVSAFSPKEIYCLDRSTLKHKQYISFTEDVEYMGQENEDYFIVTQKANAFSWLFGPECIYYRITKSGEIVQSYDKNIAPEDNLKEEFKEYRIALKLVSNGYLRESAEEVYWLSKSPGVVVETEGISGWHPTEAGIFTEQSDDNGTCRIILYNAKDGTPQEIGKVSGKQTFFTLVQDTKKDWYYMDQTDTNLELYRMDSNFQNVKLLDTISREEIISDEENCSMEIVDNKLFFYTMPEWSKSEVLYRYNLF